MKLRRSIAKKIAVAIVVFLPLIIYGWLLRRDALYDQLANSYECNRDVCDADFDGDGIPGRLERTDPSPTSSERWLKIVEGNQELLRLRYENVDETFRTHVALRSESGRTRLLLFDGTLGQSNVVSVVFSWDGAKMTQIPPSKNDREILAAMSARDGAGTWTRWVFFRTFSLPVLLAYYALLIGVPIALLIRNRIFSNISRRDLK